MKSNLFFKPTPLYKEFMIMDLVSSNQNITQRQIAGAIDVSLSMVNTYLDDYEQKGFIIRKYHNQKSVRYLLTKSGIARKKLLNIQFLEASQGIYLEAKSNISDFLDQITRRGFYNLLLYGAGEVAEILLNVINTEKSTKVKALAIIDDDINKQGNSIVNTLIIDKKMISEYVHEGILVSSYSNQEIIHKKLIALGYPEDRILHFFEY